MMYTLLVLTFLGMPALAFAAEPTFAQVVNNISEFGNLIILLIFSLSFLFVIWKIVQTWIFKGDDATAVEKGKKTLFVGVVVLAIMSGLWGILQILTSSFSTVLGG